MNTGMTGNIQESASGVLMQEEAKRVTTGKTIGSPKLSEKAQKYYDQLKKKYSNMDFILVSEDKKQEAEANAAQYANANRMVVLIDTDKVEKMAADEEYRKQYEGIIGSAAMKLSQVKDSLGANASSVKTYGMKFDDGGNASFFAVIDKSYAAQRERIEKKREEKAEAAKKAEKKERKEKLEELREKRSEDKGKISGENKKITGDKDLVTVTASSAEELLKKIDDILYEAMSDNVLTTQEKAVGQHIDFMA